MINFSDLFMDEDQYAECVKAILRKMGSRYLIALYVGATVPHSEFEKIFQQQLENEVTERGERAPDNAAPKGYWPLNDLDDEEMKELGCFFEHILPLFLENWVKGIAAAKAERKNNSLLWEVKFYLIDPEKLGETIPKYPTEWREWCHEWTGTAKDSLTAVNQALESVAEQLFLDNETHLLPGIGWTIKEVPMN